LKDLDKSEEIYQRCLEMISFEPNRYRPELFNVLGNLGEIYKKRGFTNDALGFYYEGLKELKDDIPEEAPIKADFYRRIADIYAEKGEEKEAERCLSLAMDLFSRNNFVNFIDEILECYNSWGKIHLDYGRNHLAVKFFRPMAEIEMMFYGPDVVNRLSFQLLQKSSEALGDKKDLEEVKEKLKKLKEKEDSSSKAEITEESKPTPSPA